MTKNQASPLYLSPRRHASARRRVGTDARSRLVWAARFAQRDDVAALAPSRKRVIADELMTLWPIVFENRQRVPLPSDEALIAAHARYRQILQSLLASNRAVIGPGTVVVERTSRQAWQTVAPPRLRGSEAFAAIAAAALGRLLAREGHRLKECPAPLTVGKSDPVVCGRWFVGRPNQRCCTPACANRDSTRAARFGRAVETYRGFRIEVQSHQLYDVLEEDVNAEPRMRDEWQPFAFISDEGRQVQFTPPGPVYKSKTHADQQARRKAREWVDRQIADQKRKKGA